MADHPSESSFPTSGGSEDDRYYDTLRRLTNSAEPDYVPDGGDREQVRDDTGGNVFWPSPPEDLIVRLAGDLRISTRCRECEHRARRLSNLVMCVGCGIAAKPVHRRCLTEKHRPRGQLPSSESSSDLQGEESACYEVDYRDYVYARHLLDTSEIERNADLLHADDVLTTWIGVPTLQRGPYPRIYMWSRLQKLLEDMAVDPPPQQYPNIVSFIGDTQAGKSTLIRAMVKMLEPHRRRHSVPIPGVPRDEFESTSSDIHVYPDPRTLSSKSPTFFLDCEGLDGSGAIARQIVQDLYDGHYQPRNRTRAEQRMYHATFNDPLTNIEMFIEDAPAPIELRWGKMAYLDSPARGPANERENDDGHVDSDTRKKVVKHLYPRLLYTFSDVICFVTNNGRTSTKFLTRLLLWAENGHDGTANQRSRPALVIVINNYNLSGQRASGENDDATENLLSSYEKSKEYLELQQKWHNRDKKILSARELILCYYASIDIVAIPHLDSVNPHPTQTALVSDRIKDLYKKIQAVSRRVYGNKVSLNSLFDVATLSACVRRTLETLSTDYLATVDFQGLLVPNEPVPTRFSEHMAAAMYALVKIRQPRYLNEITEHTVVEDFAAFAAACIVAQLPEPKSADKESYDIYVSKRDKLFKEAETGLHIFRLNYWRCEQLDQGRRRRCLNHTQGHDKGHQFQPFPRTRSSRDRASTDEELPDDILRGEMLCTWKPTAFKDKLWEEIKKLKGPSEAWYAISYLTETTGIAQIYSQRTCLTCLSNAPTNMLPCEHDEGRVYNNIPTPPQNQRNASAPQHGICDSCIRRYASTGHGDSLLTLNKCPLGCRFRTGPWTVRVKPETAGPRILVLDGGGVRGIVELSILAKIEETIRNDAGMIIPIHEFFDLVVGTSTGGVVALGVFHKGWSPLRSIDRFKTFARRGFTPRPGLGVSIIKSMVQPFYTFSYTSDGIETALKDAFGQEEYLFGTAPTAAALQSRARRPGVSVKTGVVTCNQGMRDPLLLANYSRNTTGETGRGDRLLRQDKQSKDFKIWEAARATTAAPMYFQPFSHDGTKKIFLDGAVVRNNPVRVAYGEYPKLWPGSVKPDIIVSLGTGVVLDNAGNVKDQRTRRIESLKLMLPPGIKTQVEMALEMAKSTMDCQVEWDAFFAAISEDDPKLADNCHRLNVGLTRRVKLDDVAEMEKLRNECQTFLNVTPSSRSSRYDRQDVRSTPRNLQLVSRRLIASLFYFSSPLAENMRGIEVQGRIHCRVSPSSEHRILPLVQKVSFRLREVSVETGEESATSIDTPGLSNGFSARRLFVPVSFSVSTGRYKKTIEMNIPEWRTRWVPISGYQ